MSYKYEDIFELVQSTANGVVNNTDSWKGFLSTAAMNYKRPFYNQLLIYNQKPEATACATFDFWNKKMGRFVKKGSKGIFTIDPVAQKKEVLFDVSDTDSRRNETVPIWRVTTEMYSPLGAALQEHFESSVTSGDLVAVLFDVGAQAVENVLPELVETVSSCREGSLLEELDEINLIQVLRETLSESLVYMLLQRCDLSPEEYSEAFNFSYIKAFNSYDVIAALGSSLNSLSNELLRDISLSVRAIDKIINLRENNGKEAENNELNIQGAGRLSDSEHLHAEAGDELREVRDVEKNIPDGREELGIHSNDDEGHTESSSERDRPEGERDGAQPDSTDGFERGRERSPEGEESNEVGRDDEQLPSFGGGDSSDRVDLHLDTDRAAEKTAEVESVAETVEGKNPNLSLEFVLTNVLQHHRFLSVTGPEIQNYFIENKDENDRIGFIREVYNKDYTEILTPGDEYRVGYHADTEGLEVWIGAYLGASSRVTVPWNVVVNAVDVLINDNQYLTESERTELPSEEQQTLFADEFDTIDEPGLILPQQVIDEVLCSGSNNRDSTISICAHYKRNHTTAENVRFLEEEYGSGTGKGFIIAGERYSVLFEEDGIRIAEGNSVAAAKDTAFLSWNVVDRRIKELLSMGRYLSAADYALVEDKLLDKEVRDFWCVHREVITEEVVERFSLKAYKELPLNYRIHSFSQDADAIKGFLADPERIKQLADETKILIDACKGKEPAIRIRAYEFARLGRVLSYLEDLSRDITEYPPEKAFEPSYKSFITDDEVNLDLTQGSGVVDGKYRIYRYFNEPHTAAEKVAFLKDEYGTGGGTNALGGVDNAYHDHDGKGIVLSKGDISKPYDTVNLSWSAVANKIDKLITNGKYLSEKEIENLPNYEKKLIAKDIYRCLEDAPLEVERPHLMSSSFYDAVDEIVEILDDDEKAKELFDSLRSYMNSLPEDARNYDYKQRLFQEVELYASGVSMFDFEARKARGEWDVRDEEVSDVENSEIENLDVVPTETDNTAYAYDVKPGDVVTIGTDRFEVLSMENSEVVVNNVDFPLFTETYALEDFNQKVRENPANDMFRVPIVSANEIVADFAGGGVSPEAPREITGVEADTYTSEGEDVVTEDSSERTADIQDVSLNEESSQTVYRYYSQLRRLEDGYPVPEGNEPLNVVSFDESTYIEDFGIRAWGYIEYASPLAFEDIAKYDLMLYEPPIVSRETLHKYQLGFGLLGNGTTVWNRLEQEHGDYKIVAHISPEGDVTYYDKAMPQEAIDKIQAVADKDRLDYQKKLEIAAEALAEVEKRYGSPFSKNNEEKTINRRTIPCRNYATFKKFAEDILNGKNTYMRFEKEGYEPLYVERISENRVAMAHTFVQNGDVCYDPEMVFTFDNEKEELQACSYELSLAGLYQEVYDDNGRANIGLQRELNSFLNTWLKNIIEQDRALVRVIDRDGNEIDLTADMGKDATVESSAEREGDIAVTEAPAADVSSVVDEPQQSEASVSEKRPGGFDFDEYLKIKDLYPDDIVAYQIGDFYEFLGEDAEKVAKELDIVLTSRDVGLSERLPMCGVPSFAFKEHMNTLIQNGYNVAVCGVDEKTGKRITVDYESEMFATPSIGGSAENGADVSDEDKLVFEAEPVSEKAEAVKSLNRENAVDYRIEDLENGSGTPKEKFRRNVEAISLLKQLETDNRLATPEEQKVLAGYVGWGGLADAFDDSKSAWAAEYKELKELLTPEEYSSARSSTLTAFYTSPVIIKFMYRTLEEMGFKKGNILEPACGIGNFIGMLPENLSDSKVYGVELDSISGRIAGQLYQKQDIRVQGFEKTDFPDSFFDVAIGNVPFNDIRLADKRYDKHNWLIHDYFFGKTLDKVRPGGIVAFVTSKGTLDKENSDVRKYLAERAEFLGAVRLPDNAFKANAGTEVTSDIIFLQKREKPIEIDADREDWIDLSYLYDLETGAVTEAPNGELMQINTYFSMHPECVLGDIKVESNQYGYGTACKARVGDELSSLLDGIHFKARQQLYERSEEEQESSLDFLPADPSVRNFSYTLVDGKVYFRENSRMFPAVFKDEDTENRVKALINLRDCVRLLIEMQTEDYSESAIIKQREALNSLYDSFTKKYGIINSRKNQRAFEEDSSYYLLASLENLDDDGKLKSKADIFYKRTIKPHVLITSVDTSAEALEVSISEKACVDIPFMVQLSGKSAEEIERDLTGVIFRVPGSVTDEGEPVFVPADEYLSGNVREKLKVAREYAEKNEIYASNVAALEKVQPKDLDASEISVRLGSTWIKPEYITEFIYELLDTPRWAQGDSAYCINVKFAPVTGEWFIENKTQDRYNVKSTTTYGTERRSAYQIVEDTLNLRDTRVYDYVEDDNGHKKAVLNREETAIAQQKQEVIKEKFVEWVWQDADRREYLTSYYNERFNNIRPREYDGSHLSFGGINPEIELRKHQLNAIARIIYGGNTLLAHAVGAGKTFEMVAAAQESKRLGLCNKSMFVVPNHLIEQFAADYMKLYPSANVLCSTKKDFEPGNRKKFCSRIATGDYDAVIIGHSQFEKIPMSVEGQKKALQEQLDEVMQGIVELKAASNERFSVKQLEKSKKNIEAKLEKLNDDSRKDDVVTFEELGVDRLFVDEAHYYKNLFLYTKMRNVAGIGSREAQKSSDLFMKCRYLDRLTGGKGVVFATGTPISNSMTELYTMQRYLQYDMLCEIGLQHFDSWASTFGETVTAIELAPEGKGYRAKTRFARFNNLPELMATFKEMADVQTADMLHLPVPKANFHVVDLQPSEIQKELVQNLADRATAIHNKLVKPNEDNMLLVTNDGRKLALDQRLIDPMFEDSDISKVNSCADNVFEIWEKNKDKKSTQLVFCDLSTPKSGEEFDVYNDLRDKLVAKGIPKNEIAFIHNAKTEQQKKNLFEKVRKGKVRVLMGSTQKLGAGTNVQDKLIALHDIDCPWRPSDLEQRLGRIVRQGNSNDEVEIYRYVTKDTFDAYLYQLIENKQSFISQIMTSKSPARSAEDIDEAVLSYAEIKSLATGDPRIKEKMDLDVTVKRLKLLKQSYLREKYSLEDKVLKKYPKDISHLTDSVVKCKKDIAVLNSNTSADKEYFFPMTIAGTVYAEKNKAGEALIEFCRNKKNLSVEECFGEYRGFKMIVTYDSWEKSFKLIMKNELRYAINLGNDKFGNITRINNLLASLPDRLADFENRLSNTYVQLENAKTQLDKPFAHEQELKEKGARLDQLNIELSLDKDNAIDIASSLDDKEPAAPKKTVPVKSYEER